MRRVISTVLGCVVFFLLTCQVQAEELYTVRIESFDSMDSPGLLKLQDRGISDLWVEKGETSFVLNAGVFPDPKLAGMLLARLRPLAPQAEIAATTVPDAAQWLPRKQQISLRDLGHERPLLLLGIQPYQAIHFPWNDTMDAGNSFLTLKLHISEALQPCSTVTFSAEGIPLLTLNRQEIQDNESLVIGLQVLKNIDIGTALDIEIIGDFRVTSDYCVDMRSKNLWLRIAADSSLHVLLKTPPLSIRSFFSNGLDDFCFASFKENRESVEALARIAGLIGSKAHTHSSRIHFNPCSLTGKNIFIGDFINNIKVMGNNIFLTPNGSKLLSNTIFPALIFADITSGEAVTEVLGRETDDLRFEMLGYDNRSGRGNGDLVFSTKFSILQLGGWPKKLLATILYSHSAVADKERAFLRVRLNGVLIHSKEIAGEGGERSTTFTLPARAIQAKNNLEIVFSYYLNNGDCTGSYPELEVALLKDSFLSVAGYTTKPPLVFSTYPAVFKGKGALLPKKFSSEYSIPLAHLMETQGYLQQVVPNVTVTTAANLETGGFDYAVSVTDSSGVPNIFEPPADLSQNLKIVNPLNNNVLVNLRTTEEIAALQLFYSKTDLPVLLYQQRNIKHSPPLEDITKVLSGHPAANVGIISETGLHAMEVGTKFHLRYPDEKNLSFYWQKYRFILFILFGTLLLFFLFYIYHRLAKE